MLTMSLPTRREVAVNMFTTACPAATSSRNH